MHKWTIKIESVQWIKLNDNKLKWAETYLKQQSDYLFYLFVMQFFFLSLTFFDEKQNHFKKNAGWDSHPEYHIAFM